MCFHFYIFKDTLGTKFRYLIKYQFFAKSSRIKLMACLLLIWFTNHLYFKRIISYHGSFKWIFQTNEHVHLNELCFLGVPLSAISQLRREISIAAELRNILSFFNLIPKPRHIFLVSYTRFFRALFLKWDSEQVILMLK